jgi:hypothetical protein
VTDATARPEVTDATARPEVTDATARPGEKDATAVRDGATGSAALLADGRLHLQHGPIDLLIGADGTAAARSRAFAAARERFAGLLVELVAELPLLRARLGAEPPPLAGPVARRMLAATWPHRNVYITPMAAVAGAVADEILAAMTAAAALDRAYVNNGGDIALHLAPGATFEVGVVGDLARPRLDSAMTLRAGDGIGGIATSGWRGRSQSLGIADAVTVLAATAAAADAGTKPIGMAVDASHPAIARRPARELRPESDLGELPVVVAVGPLPAGVAREALENGAAVARALRTSGTILGAYLQLQAQFVAVAPELSRTEGTPARIPAGAAFGASPRRRS